MTAVDVAIVEHTIVVRLFSGFGFNINKATISDASGLRFSLTFCAPLSLVVRHALIPLGLISACDRRQPQFRDSGG